MNALLEISNLTVSYGRGHKRNTVLHELGAQIGTGEIVGLIGETGSGKTTLARSILSLVKPDAGSIRLEGQELVGLTGKALRRFRQRGAIQYVFQDPLQSLDPDRTIAQSLVEPLVIRGERDREALSEAGERAIERVGLSPNLLDRLPSGLSGGQRQRVVIARALVSEPKLLICDEPVSALDASNRIEMLELFSELRRTAGISQLFISHDLGSVAGISDRILVLQQGSIVEQGSPEAIIANPQHPYTKLLINSAPVLHDHAE